MLRIAAALAAGLMSLSAHADPRAEVLAAYEKMLNGPPYQSDMTVVAGGRTSKTTVIIDLPDRFHIKNEGGEFILTPEGNWMKPAGSAQWMQPPMDLSAMKQPFSPELVEKGMAAIANVEALGTERVGSADTKVYRYTQDLEVMGVRSESTSTVYVDQATGLPVRFASKGKAMGVESDTTQDLRYDEGLAVKAPN